MYNYDKIYLKGLQPVRIYGLPKMHKARSPGSIPSIRPIVSSTGAYKYDLSKYLRTGVLAPQILQRTPSPLYLTSKCNKFMASFDVESLLLLTVLQMRT